MAKEEIQDSPQNKSRRKSPVYEFLTSMKVGVILLLILTVACVLGTLVPQGQPAEVYQQHYRVFTSRIVLRLGIDHTFSTWWFNSLAGLLAASLAMCSWRRLRTLLRAQHPQVQVSLSRLTAMRASGRFTSRLSRPETAERIAGWLGKNGYKAQREETAEATCFYARKGTISQWGTLLVHISLLVIMLGALYGNLPSIRGVWLNRSYSADAGLKEGEKFTVSPPRSKPFQIQLLKASGEFDLNGMPLSYESKVRVWEDGRAVQTGTISMNHPVYYRGVSMIMQQYFPSLEKLQLLVKAPGAAPQQVPIPMLEDANGPAVDMMGSMTKLKANGWMVFAHDYLEAPIDKNGRVILGTNGRARQALPGEETTKALTVFAVENPMKEGMQGWKRVGYVTPAGEVDYKGVKFSLQVKSGSAAVINLHKDPGIPLVFAGFGLLMLGVMLAFYISQRTLRLRLWEEKGKVRVAAGVRSRGGLAWAETELEKIRTALSNLE